MDVDINVLKSWRPLRRAGVCGGAAGTCAGACVGARAGAAANALGSILLVF